LPIASLATREDKMYKFTLALLLLVAAHSAVLGKSVDSDAFRKPSRATLKSTQRIHNDEFLSAAAKTAARKLTTGTAARSSAANSRQTPQRAPRSNAPALNNAHARRLAPPADTPKSVSRGRKTPAEDAARREATQPTNDTPTRRERRASARMSEPFPSGLRLPIVKGNTRVGEKHYDPTGSNAPLLNTSKTYSGMNLSENFKVGELSQSGGIHSDESRIDRRLVICLQSIRDAVGQPVWVRSGYRSYWRNLQVYRDMGKPATDSQHIAGKASDIKVEGMTGLELSKVAVDACGTDVAVGIGLEFAHIDVRGYFGSWLYDGVPKGQLVEIRQYRRNAVIAAARGQGRAPRRSLATKPAGGSLPAGSGSGSGDTVSRPARDARR
jgi:hypothetical protein